jgi:hypothetical protein
VVPPFLILCTFSNLKSSKKAVTAVIFCAAVNPPNPPKKMAGARHPPNPRGTRVCPRRVQALDITCVLPVYMWNGRNKYSPQTLHNSLHSLYCRWKKEGGENNNDQKEVLKCKKKESKKRSKSWTTKRTPEKAGSDLNFSSSFFFFFFLLLFSEQNVFEKETSITAVVVPHTCTSLILIPPRPPSPTTPTAKYILLPAGTLLVAFKSFCLAGEWV